MRCLLFVLTAALFLLFVGRAAAQTGGNISNGDVTVQLPSYQATGVNTTVLVPDRGPTQLSRRRQALYERSYYGRFQRYRPTTTQQLYSSLNSTAHASDPRAAEAERLRIARSRRANWTRGTNFATRRYSR